MPRVYGESHPGDIRGLIGDEQQDSVALRLQMSLVEDMLRVTTPWDVAA